MNNVVHVPKQAWTGKHAHESPHHPDLASLLPLPLLLSSSSSSSSLSLSLTHAHTHTRARYVYIETEEEEENSFISSSQVEQHCSVLSHSTEDLLQLHIL
ncbi:hypothetical protein KSP39_PZI002626 [Platanthera zijinensis]|uniref:Uncharacterized protein n=1 Tax=Platanthera zijinensis TaxID=2320716 RepID=A0AAP0BZ65_9ASPA